MGYHREHLDELGRWHRTGTHRTKQDALQVAVASSQLPALVLEDHTDSISHGVGEVVAAVLANRQTVEEVVRPEWWDRLDADTQERTLVAGGAAAEVEAIVKAGGWAVATQWEGQPPSEWQLSTTDEDWLHVEAARREVQAGQLAN